MTTFRWIESGVVADYPDHYATHPVFGNLLERYELGDDEYEEDKVVFDNHAVLVEQRSHTVAKSLEQMTVVELQSVLEERGLTTSGNKSELVERIVADNVKNDEEN